MHYYIFYKTLQTTYNMKKYICIRSELILVKRKKHVGNLWTITSVLEVSTHQILRESRLPPEPHRFNHDSISCLFNYQYIYQRILSGTENVGQEWSANLLPLEDNRGWRNDQSWVRRHQTELITSLFNPLTHRTWNKSALVTRSLSQ